MLGEKTSYLQEFHILVVLKVSLSCSFILRQPKLETAWQWSILSGATYSKKRFLSYVQILVNECAFVYLR